MSTAVYKSVDIITQKPIRTTSIPILSTTFNVRLKLEDILVCILEKATILEILPSGKKLRLDLDNYKLDNSIGGGGNPTPPTSNGKPETFPFVSNVLDDGVTANYLVTGEAIKNYVATHGGSGGGGGTANIIDGLGFTSTGGGVIRVKRGSRVDLPSLAAGEFGLALDSKQLFVGGLAGNISIPTAADLAGKVDTVPGKGLSTNDYDATAKAEVAKIANKVDAVAGKGLSTNDYDATAKAEVAKVTNKVDKVAGKGLSTNDYDDAAKAEVAKVTNKVDKVAGKGLSTNDYDDVDKALVATIGNKADNTAITNLQGQIDTLRTQVNRLNNAVFGSVSNPFTINSFTAGTTTAEMGATLSSVTFTWAYSDTCSAQTFEGQTVDPALRSYNYTTPITANKTFTLSATSSDGATIKSSTVTISFLNGVYYGVSSSTAYNAALISSLTKVLTGTKARSITVDAANAGDYIYYCLPTRLGTPGFKVGGFDGGFAKMTTISYTNSKGYTENYDIYRSDNPGLGVTTVDIT